MGSLPCDSPGSLGNPLSVQTACWAVGGGSGDNGIRLTAKQHSFKGSRGIPAQRPVFRASGCGCSCGCLAGPPFAGGFPGEAREGAVRARMSRVFPGDSENAVSAFESIHWRSAKKSEFRLRYFSAIEPTAGSSSPLGSSIMCLTKPIVRPSESTYAPDIRSRG